jgi:hypothetical protein
MMVLGRAFIDLKTDAKSPAMTQNNAEAHENTEYDVNGHSMIDPEVTPKRREKGGESK